MTTNPPHPTSGPPTGISRTEVAARYVDADAEVRTELDRLAALAARICVAPVAWVSVVVGTRKVILGSIGLAVREIARDHSFCAVAMYQTGCLTVPDARADARFAENPLVTAAPHIRFYAGEPLVADGGSPLGTLCVADMVPRDGLDAAQVEALGTLAAAAIAHLERWRTARESAGIARSRGDPLHRRFHVLAEALPQLVWSSTEDGQSDYFNDHWCRFTGAPAEASFGAGWLDFVHPDDQDKARAAWDGAVARGRDYAAEYRLRRHDGTWRWMVARGLPVHDDDGAVVRWVGTCTDIDERVRTGELLELMSQELSHRIKNLFSVVQGLITLTVRNRPEFADVNRALQSRMVALGRAHDLTRPRMIGGGTSWRSETTLHEMVRRLLEPLLEGELTRLRLSGDDVVVGEPAATPIALFMNEMATNSLKHGAFSAALGAVDLTVAAVGESVTITWREHGGPAITAPPKPGFGLRLAHMSIERQLGGKLDMAWHPEGLTATACVPTRQLTPA